MRLRMLIREKINFDRFKKTYKKNHEQNDFSSNLHVCDSFVRLLSNKKKLELVKLYKCYTYLCMDNEKEFQTLRIEIKSPENQMMILYYNLILNIEVTNEEFLPLYEEFINHRFKVNGTGAFFVLKKEVDYLRDFLVNHTNIPNKNILEHIKKSKLAQMKRLYNKMSE